MEITAVGLDLAKNVFQAHCVDERGHAVVKKALKRHQVVPMFANMPSCLIGMEACASAHHWARKLQPFGASGGLPSIDALWSLRRAADIGIA